MTNINDPKTDLNLIPYENDTEEFTEYCIMTQRRELIKDAL